MRLVSEMMGDGVLMFGSDYPHAESRFPRSVHIVLGWRSVAEDPGASCCGTNAVRCFGEP